MVDYNGRLPGGLCWASFKGISHFTGAQCQGQTQKRLMLGERERQLGFHASYNALGNVLIDLIPFQPASIKIYQADMLLTVMRSPGYTPDSINRHDELNQIKAINISNHDPITNFLFIQRVFDTGRIVGDPRFSQVMEMSEQEYCAQLENNYGAQKIHQLSH